MRIQLLAGLAAVAAAAGAPFALVRSSPQELHPGSRGYVAIKAGTIHLVEEGKILEHGTLLLKGNSIQAVGTDLAIPVDARIVDYGPDAVIVPGLFAADSGFATGLASDRTAAPGVRAIDNFDFYAENAAALAAGVTTAYLKPTDARLIGGEGAVVKLTGKDAERRTLKSPATVNGAIHSGARNTPGYWDPPVPATSDVGLGYAVDQLPKTTMGAIVALSELLDAARGERPTEEYGPHAVAELAQLLDQGLPWRITAESEGEIRALLDFAREKDVSLILEGATEAGYVAEEIAAAGVPVVYSLPWSPNGAGRDRGKDEDDRWPSYDAAAKLVAAGVRVAIGSDATSDLFFAAAVASQGKLDPAAALRAITLTPAEIYGVADRVGSLHPGKDADFVVLMGSPIAFGASPVATWVDGELAWSFETSGARARAVEDRVKLGETVVIQVDELHLGDGQVLTPGQIVMRNGKILSVSEGSSQQPGVRIVRGAAAMPGIIDALGFLGLEGSNRVPGLDTALSSIIAPGDATDRRVAKGGVTTVALAPRGTGSGGAPVLAYKPAAEKLEGQVLGGDPTAVRLQWTDVENRLNSGKDVQELLAKAKEYRDKWIEYEKAIAAWVPPPAAPPKEADAKEGEKKDEAEKDGEKDEKKDEAAEEKKGDEKKADAKEGEKKDEDKKDDEGDKKDKKGKKKDAAEEDGPDPITGVWTASVEAPPAPPEPLRLQLKLTLEEGGGPLTGNLRCAAVTDGLIDVKGYYDDEAKTVALRGLGSRGWVSLEGAYAEAKLKGTLAAGATSLEVELERTSREYVVAKRSERRKPKEEDAAEEPKGKPKAPRLDPRLEPLRGAMDGKTAVIVNVQREDEILACVDAFASFGIKPVLYDASGVEAVAARIVGRVKGVLLSHVIRGGGQGTDTHSAYAAVQDAGIPVAFHSEAEEGAVDLPLMAMYAIANGMTPAGALRALTADAADMLSISARVGRLAPGHDGDVLLLDGPPLAPGTSILRVWVNGVEVR